MQWSLRTAILGLALALGFTLLTANITQAQQADRDHSQIQEDRGNQQRSDRDHDADRDRGVGQTDRDRDRNESWRNGQQGWRGENNPAYQAGWQDGINDGMKDRQSGHSYRATQEKNYKHGDRGYSSNLGDKGHYQQMYRQAYERGYEQGYNGQSAGQGYGQAGDWNQSRRDRDHGNRDRDNH